MIRWRFYRIEMKQDDTIWMWDDDEKDFIRMLDVLKAHPRESHMIRLEKE